MKSLSTLVAAACLLASASAWGGQPGFRTVAVEVQVKLLSLELPADRTDRSKVDAAMTEFTRRHKLRATDTPKSPLWNIDRVYIGSDWVSVDLSFLPQHTFIGLSKRPGDASAHDDLVQDMQATFGPLGFRPWVEPAD